MGYWPGYFFILVVGTAGLMVLINYWRRAGAAPILVNLALLMLSLFLTLMAIEFYFKNFFAEPDIANTLARRNWYEWYYEDLNNSLGYRDVEWTPEMVDGRIKVTVSGDSFVAGAGIARVEERFSNQLAQKLGGDYVVFNLGKNGANTGQAIEAITEYPYPPDILVFSYYLNDIESVGPPCQGQPGLLSQVPAGLAPLINNSYAVNFFYWRLARLVQAGQPDLRWDCLLHAYTDPDIWWLHQQELLSIYEGARAEEIPLFVVVFPSMFYLEQSRAATGQVVNLYRERQVPVVDVADLVRELPAGQRVASSMDTHASPLVNQLVAEALYSLFMEAGVVR